MADTANDPPGTPDRDEFDMTGVKEAASLSTIGVVLGAGIPAVLFVLAVYGAATQSPPAEDLTTGKVAEPMAAGTAVADVAMDDAAMTAPHADLASACNAANTPAAGDQCNALGIKYLDGDGVAKNPVTAIDQFDLGCDKGSMMACANAGMLYGGYPGVSAWPERSFELLQRACNANVAFGCSELGLNYQNGIGVAQDLNQARNLFAYACDQGVEQACEYRRKLDAQGNF